MVEIFIDTANLSDIKEIMSWGIVDGCTTNPKIIFEEKGCNFEMRMKEILKLVKGPVSIEVTTNDTGEMIKEAEVYNTWGNNVVVKIPMTIEGLKAVKVLKEKNIKTNVTACMNTNQAILAAKAGATYISLFWGRIEDLGYNATKIVEDTADIFRKHGFESKIIIGSFREVSHVQQAFSTGAHVLTITPKILQKLPIHPRTDSTIQEFLDFWAEFKKTEKK